MDEPDGKKSTGNRVRRVVFGFGGTMTKIASFLSKAF